MMNFSKLDYLKQTPRDLESAKSGVPGDKYGCNPPAWWMFWYKKEEWEVNMTRSVLRYVGIVQANSDLFDPEEASLAPAVHLRSEDPRAAEPQFMLDLLAMIDIARADDDYRGPLTPLIDALDDEDSDFDITLPTSCTGGAIVKAVVELTNPLNLPHGFIPEHRILPVLISELGYSIIDPKFYL